jgi:hypothetical protein
VLSVPRTFRRLAVAASIGATLATGSGCAKPVDMVAGVAGISMTPDGRPLGVLLVCGHHLDGATLYRNNGDGTTTTVGSWVGHRALTGLTTWPLENPGPGWTTRTALAPLSPRTTYHLYGWTKDDTWSAGNVAFTLDDWHRLTPGQVRFETSAHVGVHAWTAATLTAFHSHACDAA